MAESGIYEIVNLVNGKRYVGSAVNLRHRWRQHRCELGKGRHNRCLQNAWNKYGEARFEFRVIEIVADKGRLIEREQHYIDALKPEYNLAKVAGSNLGMKWSPETLARMGEASRKMWQDPEHRRRMSEAHKGFVQPREVVERRAAARRGVKLSPEHAAKIAEANRKRNQDPGFRARMSAHWKGRIITPEMRAKISATKKGCTAHNKGVPMSTEQKAKQSAIMARKYEEDPEFRARISAATKAAMNTPEMRAKLSAANTGRKQSSETIAKRVAALRGKRRTPEQRAAMSDRTKAFYARKRASAGVS